MIFLTKIALVQSLNWCGIE